MIEVGVKVEGDEAVASAFDSLDAYVSEPRRVLSGAGEAAREHARRRFADEGPGWPGLTEAYARRKAAKHGAQKLLHAEGALEASLTEEDAEFSVQEPDSGSLTVGSSHPAALAHQEGVAERSLPARPVYDVGEGLAEEAVEAIERDLTGYARELGLAA